nr:hypothetical protein [uncultured Capnocytophaga sp.]
MKLRNIVLFSGLLIAQVSFAQVEEVGTMTDTTVPVVENPIVAPTEVQSEAELKNQKELLKAQQREQKAQEKALKAEEKAAKEKAKAEKEAQKAQEKAKKAEEKAAKEKAKAEKEAQKKKERLSKANSEVAKVEAKIAKAKTDLAKEQSKFDIKKAKGTLSPQDEAKLKSKLLNKQQKINSLGLDLIKAKEKVNKYSM